MDSIRIRGARTHNLQNIDVDLPRDRLTVITGLSGSGKSSLAFDTLYAEGQRRYVESLSAYARQFLSVMDKPDVDLIEGLSPAIAIEQKSAAHNPRSTVATVTEIHDYLRLLFARAGEPRCPEHGLVLSAQSVSEMVDAVLALPEGTRLMLLAPLVEGRKGEHAERLEQLRAQGFVRVRIDGNVHELDALPAIDRRSVHTIEAVVDRFRVRPDIALRLAESFDTALALADGRAEVAPLDGHAALPGGRVIFSSRFACPVCRYSLPSLEPRLFSFNSPTGACPECGGLGTERFFDPHKIVAHPELSLAGGAIRGWDRRNHHYFRLLLALARHYGFDIDASFDSLPEAVRTMLLEGSGSEQIAFEAERGRTVRKPFEGIVPNMRRRYRETQSALVREGLARFLGTRPCPACGGSRLNVHARHVFIAGRSLPEVGALTIGAALGVFETLALPGQRGAIAERIVREIAKRLRFLDEVGLAYLALDRPADTLSGGEAQRIRLASQIGAGLVGVTYILDEPSIGLHPRDNRRLLDTLAHLRDMGNTVVVVEHDAEAILGADHVIDMGPGAGVHGGRVVAQGTPREIMEEEASLTGQYLSGRRRVARGAGRLVPRAHRTLCLRGAGAHNLKNIDVCFPVGLFTCVTGVSGSGKSTLVNDTLWAVAAHELNRADTTPAAFAGIEGLEHFDKAIDIDQSPIGRTPRSNPATYTGLFGAVRELFAATREARSRGYGPGRFSFNVKGGRCEACGGDGVIRVEMHFLPDVYVRCDRCAGRRYNRETLQIRYKGLSIDEVLDLTVEQAAAFFAPVPALARKLATLTEVGLSYLRLGQSATTLSGGEAQRIKLARELSRRDTGKTLYVLDEPTTGLHFADVAQLLEVLLRLRDRGNTVIVIEHNLDVIASADWVIDLGPEGGDQGGRVVDAGPPEALAARAASHTGRHLAAMLARSPGFHDAPLPEESSCPS